MRLTCGLAFHGPLQAWGFDSMLGRRDTGNEPTRSALIGILRCAAGAGHGSDDLFVKYDQLSFTIRTDRPGRRLRDYHTISSNKMVLGNGKLGPATIQSNRYYLSDAAFLVLITGAADTVAAATDHLDQPHWALSLGRRSCPPSAPFLLGTSTIDPLELIENAPVMGAAGETTASIDLDMVAAATARGWRATIDQPPTATRPAASGDRQFTYDQRATYRLDTHTTGGPLDLAEWWHTENPR